MNESFTNRRLVLAIAPDFPVQGAFDEAFAPEIITLRHPQTDPVFPSTLKTKDETKDCSGEYLLIRKVTSRISQFTFTYDATAKTGAGWLGGYGLGVAGAPTGTPLNEQQRIKTTNTAGSPLFGLDLEGLTETVALPFNSTPAQALAKLQNLRPVKKGNILVTGTSLNDTNGLLIEFINKLAKANIPTFSVAENGATGGTSTVTTVQNGANKLHHFTRMTGEKPVKFSVVSGYEGATGGAKLYRNLIVGSVTVRAVKRGKVQITVVAFGSADYEVLDSYTMPACVNVSPIMVADCRLKIGSLWITDDLREFSYTYTNGFDPNDPDNFPFDDIDIAELEKGDRTSVLTAQVQGNDTTPLFVSMENPDGFKDDFELHVGQPGERFSVYATNAQFELDDAPITHIGSKNKSAFNITATPTPDDSTGIVDRVDYHGAFATQYLLEA